MLTSWVSVWEGTAASKNFTFHFLLWPAGDNGHKFSSACNSVTCNHYYLTPPCKNPRLEWLSFLSLWFFTSCLLGLLCLLQFFIRKNFLQTMASWLVHSSPDRGVQVWALARDIVLCSWARHLHVTLTVPLSTQEYKWVPVNCWGNLTNCGGETYNGLASRLWELAILLP